MTWFRDLRQTMSYKLGFARGSRNRKPIKYPWWVDKIVYVQAYMDGIKVYSASKSNK
jgi:hypothetical protein